MEVTLRESIPEDAKPIFALRCDSRLQSMQYGPSIFETPHTLIALSHQGNEIPTTGLKSTTILVDGDFAGHIMQIHKMSFRKRLTIELGWNLVPHLWGKGIMVIALQKLLDERFRTSSRIEFVACCFASNQRSIRVIEKLGFQPDKLTIAEHIFHFTKTWGRQRIKKYRLKSNSRHY